MSALKRKKDKRKRTATNPTGSPSGEPKLSTYRLKVIERHLQVLELRKVGVSFDRIALAVTPPYKNEAGARWAFRSIIKSRYESPADEMRKLELERLDAMQRAQWPAVSQGKPRAAEAVLKIMDRRSKLTGLDVPTQVEVFGKGGGPVQVTEVLVRGAADSKPA